MRIVATVGMGPWPFDRLLRGLAPLTGAHDLLVQSGTSTVELACDQRAFLSFDDFQAALQAADVVVTHAGNTVRLVQRLGKVPIAVAREAARGEMGNDHQVRYLRAEARRGRVVACWDVAQLPALVAGHAAAERALLERPLPPPADPERVRLLLDQLCARWTR